MEDEFDFTIEELDEMGQVDLGNPYE